MGRTWLELWRKMPTKPWRRRLGSSKQREASWRMLFWLLVVGSMLGSVWIYWFMSSQAELSSRESLARMCNERAGMLQRQFRESLDHIQALSILVSSFHHGKVPSVIDQETFAKYTEKTLFERPLTDGVAYAAKVTHSERAEFEKQKGWVIKRMRAEYQFPLLNFHQASPVQEEYAPVIFAQDTVRHLISLDMLSGKGDRENILRARKSGKGVLTSPFKLLPSNHIGVIMTFPVYKPEPLSNMTPAERVKASIGYMVGIFDIEALIDKLLHRLACKTVIVNVFDTTNPSVPVSIYGSVAMSNNMHHISSLNFGDPYRSHEMHCSFKHKLPLPWLATTTSIGTLVMALLVCFIFHATMKRIDKMEEEYRLMIEMKRRAEAADVAKSQFLAKVSHEIRTPMTGVLGMLEMLMGTALNRTQKDHVELAQGSGKALLSLINGVLDQTRIESGKFELEAVQFDLRMILDQQIASLSSLISREKGLELAAYVSDRVPEFLIGDQERFRQIITNLVGNSLKFTERGHVLVTVLLAEEVMCSVELEQEFSSTNTLSGFPVAQRRPSWENFGIFKEDDLKLCPALMTSSTLVNLVISVEDTGIGISKEARSRIFLPFMQEGPSTARTYGGTGIGLNISKLLIRLMNGELGISSEPGVGSTFSFSATFKDNAKSSEPEISEFQGMKAWVIDFRPVRGMVTKYHLQRFGISVEVMSGSKQALSHIVKEGSVVNIIFIEREAWSMDSDLWTSYLSISQENLPKVFLLVNPSRSTKIIAEESLGFIPTVITKPLTMSVLAASLQHAMRFGEKNHKDDEELDPLSSLRCLLRGRKILVVDDTEVNLKVAAGFLKNYGANVLTVASGKEAVEILKPPHKFDACFMDIQMPELDGFQSTKRVRDMESNFNELIRSEKGSMKADWNVKYWHIPILAMTADVIQSTQEKCLKSGMNGYVSKPFEAAQLYEAVSKFFPNSKSYLSINVLPRFYILGEIANEEDN